MWKCCDSFVEPYSHISYKSAILLGDANRQISDLKFKLAKSEQEITALEQNVSSRFVLFVYS